MGLKFIWRILFGTEEGEPYSEGVIGTMQK